MDPIGLATVTSALTMLASEVGKGLASEGSKDLWKKIKAMLGLNADPSPEEVAPTIAKRLEQTDPLVTVQIVNMLKAQPAGAASQIVGSIHQAEGGRIVIGHQINVAGDFHM